MAASISLTVAMTTVNSIGLNRADIKRNADYSRTEMNPQKVRSWLLFEKSTLLKAVRKVAIVLLLLGSVLPSLATNIGLYAEQAGWRWSEPLIKLKQPFPSFHALLLCQVWGLFAYISPFNFTMHFEVERTDGQVVPLRDLKKEGAGKWQSLLFHNEPKTEINLYADRRTLRQYTEYLVRTNGLNPLEIGRRTIFIRYRNVLPRDQAATAGTYYGPETNSVLDSY
jgi:hypothetical protein